ncbi:MAG: polyprenyl synthetase family protein [Phycisphaerales bacterium]|nr:MAG: polyprenyl synthetase family protein [Phycisphaerales bacterium]
MTSKDNNPVGCKCSCTSASASADQGDSVDEPIRDRLKAFAAQFDQHFQGYLNPTADVPPRLLEAIRYSALAPGKRIRPYLVVRCCKAVGGQRGDAWPVAAAVECVHAFSLIHDDLPAMDDDALRRGRPTCHKEFGEAIAILAGDALVALAFELLTANVKDRELASQMALELSRGAGWAGMIGGQAADVLGESQPPSLELVKYIHERKTAGLFQAACRLGALAGHGTPEQVDSLGRFGLCLGQAFQIVDDLLDLTSTTEVMGKEVGKDAGANKQSIPTCVGIERSRTMATEMANEATKQLAGLGENVADLSDLLQYVISRNY